MLGDWAVHFDLVHLVDFNNKLGQKAYADDALLSRSLYELSDVLEDLAEFETSGTVLLGQWIEPAVLCDLAE